jgi:hypothetical protein
MHKSGNNSNIIFFIIFGEFTKCNKLTINILSKRVIYLNIINLIVFIKCIQFCLYSKNR